MESDVQEEPVIASPFLTNLSCSVGRIAQNSCNGDFACFESSPVETGNDPIGFSLTGSVEDGSSCNAINEGDRNMCFRTLGEIGASSCNGDLACNEVWATTVGGKLKHFLVTFC